MQEQLKLLLQAQPVSLKTLPPDLVRSWQTPEGITRVESAAKGDPDDNETLRKFAAAVLAASQAQADRRAKPRSRRGWKSLHTVSPV